MAVLAEVHLAAAHRLSVALALLIVSALVLVLIGIWLWQVNRRNQSPTNKRSPTDRS
jgi:membrane protein DedA with SNARE-associated domain